MFKVLLVDDENSILESLMILINWEEHGFSVVGTASSAGEAYEKICSFVPDVVIADIRMPDLTGLELLNMIKDNFPHIKSIIISGYQDFEYAREAIKSGASNYLLKPVNRSELIDTLKKIKKCISCEPENLADKDMLEESISIVRNRFLNSVIEGRIKNTELIKSKMEEFDIDMDFSEYNTLMVDIDFFDNGSSKFPRDNIELIKVACANIMENTVLKKFQKLVFYMHENRAVAVLNSKDLSTNHVLSISDKLRQSISGFLKIPVTILVSRCYKGISSLPLSYKDVLTAAKYKMFFGKNSVIEYGKVSVFISNTFKIPVDIEKKIISSVIYNDKSSIESLTEDLFMNLINQKATPDNILHECASIFGIINRNTVEIGVDISEEAQKASMFLRNGLKDNSVEQLKECFSKILYRLTDKITSMISSNYSDIIDQICEYIKVNYSEQINLSKMSEKFYISPSYISRLFKKHVSDNFADYLIKVRIEEAKKLLKSTNLKIYQISEKVGYTNPKYFSQLFQKITGLTPKEYRESIN